MTSPFEPHGRAHALDTQTALVLSAHGTVEHLDELVAFLTNIRRGNPPPDALVAEVRRRYERIGGRSPLLEITERQAARAAALLGVRPAVAMRLWHPYPREVLASLYAAGVRRFISVPAAPFSLPIYHEALREAARALEGPVTLLECGEYGTHRSLVRGWCAAIERALASRVDPAFVRARRVHVLFTAHSLPTAVVARGDRYPALVDGCVRAVVAATDALRDGALAWSLAYQSQGLGGGAWLGPDLPTALRAAKEAGASAVLFVPVGFLSEHVEVRYDLDVEAVELGHALDLAVARTDVLDDDPLLCEALADAARGAREVPR